jgi:hypothetical protein
VVGQNSRRAKLVLNSAKMTRPQTLRESEEIFSGHGVSREKLSKALVTFAAVASAAGSNEVSRRVITLADSRLNVVER